MAVFAEEIPEFDGRGFEGEIGECEVGDPLGEFWAFDAGAREAGEIAFDIRHEDGDAEAAELFGNHAEGDCFPGARRAGDEAVAVGHIWKEELFLCTFGN